MLTRTVVRGPEGRFAAEVVVPFEVEAPEVARARDLIRSAGAEHRVDALVDALRDPEGFGLRYEWATSGTATQTLARGAGNCLSLSSTIVGLARATYRKMVQNLWWATGYNVVAIPLAAGVLFSAGVLLTPAVGAAFMSLSTVIVAINARLLKM